MSKSKRFKVIRQTGILIRDVLKYLVIQLTIDKKEKHYRKLQTKELDVSCSIRTKELRSIYQMKIVEVMLCY